MNLGKENEILEHKLTTSEKDDACDDVAAILNKHKKGTLYFGTKSNGDVVGQTIGLDSGRTVAQSISAHIEPKIFPTIETFRVDSNGGLVKVDLDDSKFSDGTFVPFNGVIKLSFSGTQIPYSSFGRYFKRVDDQDKQVSMVELRKMFAEGGYEPILEVKAEKQTLTFNSLAREFEAHGHHYPDISTLGKNMDFRNEDGDYNLFADLLSDQCPFSIKAVRFEGNDKSALPHNNELGRRSLIDAANAVLGFAQTLNETKTTEVGMKRATTKLFDDMAFREAWLNAVVHTNWLERTPPAVYFFNDHLEIVSHGGLPYSLSVEEFFSNTSKPVNQSLFDVFNWVGLGDQTGHGVSKVTEKYGKDVFEISESFVHVRIPYAFIPDFAFASSVGERLSPIQKEVLRAFSANQNATAEEVSASLKINYNSVVKAIQKLKSAGLLSREGSKKNGVWLVKSI